MVHFTPYVAIMLTGAVAASFSSAELEGRSPPQASGIQFDCSRFMDVCQNMCWGAYCVSSSSSYLIWDRPSTSLRRRRRLAAACLDNKSPGNNRCSAGRPGAIANYNCDEYPFQSAKSNVQAAGTTQENRCSRCVPKTQNSRQGSVIANGYGVNGKCKNVAPCTITIFFANAGTTTHCNPGGAGNCNADSGELCSGPINVVQRRTIETRDSLELGIALGNGTIVTGPARFRTVGGTILEGPHGGTIGQAIYNSVPINETLWEQQTEDHVYDEDVGLSQYGYILRNMRVEVDYLKEVLWQGGQTLDLDE